MGFSRNKMFVVSVIVIFFILMVALFLKKLFWVPGVPSLKNKHVLITGGSSGIGKSVALEAARLGAHVTLVARNEGKLAAAAEEIKRAVQPSREQRIEWKSLDVTAGSGEVEEAVRALEESVGPVFLLVNCAGMAVCAEFEHATENDFRYMMDLNYFGTVHPTLCVAKRMKSRKEGHIVITGSQASLIGIYGMSAYCSSKFALRGFAECLYVELKPFNVSVTICLPPDTDTPGFVNEEKSKPEVTRLISETAGLFKPEAVAHRLLADALEKKFFSSLGFEGFVLTTLCAGMSPICSLGDIILEVSLMSLLRLVSVGYLVHFQRLITTYVKTSPKKKD